MSIDKNIYYIEEKDKMCGLCGVSCRKDNQIEDLNMELEFEKEKRRDLEDILKEFGGMKSKIPSFLKKFNLQISVPFAKNIFTFANEIDKISLVLTIKRENIHDIWFVIEEMDPDLEFQITGFFCDLWDEFDELDLDILTLPTEDFDLEEKLEEGFQLLYVKS